MLVNNARGESGMAAETNLPDSIPFHFVARWQQRGKMASDVEVHMKQSYVTEFLHQEKNSTHDIQWCLLMAYGDQPVNVSTARPGVVHSSNGNGDMKDKPCFRQLEQLTHCKMKSLNRLIHEN